MPGCNRDPGAAVDDLLRDAHPQFVERARPGRHSINYHDPVAGFVCAIYPSAERAQLVLQHGARLPDPGARLCGAGRQVRRLDHSAPSDADADFLDLAVELGAAMRTR